MGVLDDAIREHLDLKRRRGADPSEVERAEREALSPVRRGPGKLADADLSADQPLAFDHEGEAQGWDESPESQSEPLGSPSALDHAFETATAEVAIPAEPRVFDEPGEGPSGDAGVSGTRLPGPAKASSDAVKASVSRAAEALPERTVDAAVQSPAAAPPLRWHRSSPSSERAGAAVEPPPRAPPDPAETPVPHPAEAPPQRSDESATQPPAGTLSERRAGDRVGDETVEYRIDHGGEAQKAKDEDVLEETPEFLQDTPEHDRLWFEQRPPRDFDFES